MFYLSDLGDGKKKKEESGIYKFAVELRLDEKVFQSADQSNDVVYELNFNGIDDRHILSKQSKILDIYSHNNNQRLTFVT